MFRVYKEKTIFKEMTNPIKISGKIINYNDSCPGEIIFDENIIKINKLKEINTENYIIPGFVDLHCHGGGGFDTMDGIHAIKKMSKYVRYLKPYSVLFPRFLSVYFFVKVK